MESNKRIEPISDIQIYQNEVKPIKEMNEFFHADIVQEKRIFETCDEGTFNKQLKDESYDQCAQEMPTAKANTE